MDLTFTADEQAFRDELRAWLQAHHPGEPPRDHEEAFAYALAWQAKLNEGGWAGVHWPKEYGGRGATLVEAAIFNEELARVRAPQPANVLGIVLGGPTLMVHGTEEQKERFLPPILSGEEVWCQGFSEPGSGSDLASLKTRARKVDGGFRVTGQKVWTSYAHKSKWCMLVARTDADVPKHKGLTWMLLDVTQPEVEIVPLRQITGEAEFNELFLEDAFVPDENVVGGVGNGWNVALTTLMNERSGLAFGLQVRLANQLDRLVEEAGALNGEAAAVGALATKVESLRLLNYRGLTTQMTYGVPGPEGSLAKMLWSETNQELTELAAELLGPAALEAGSSWAYEVLRARGNTIEGGTTEILKNIIAERVLGLPKLR